MIMIAATCKHCQTLVYGGITKDWYDSTVHRTPERAARCKDKMNMLTNQKHEPRYWHTEGDGVVVYDNRYHKYIFVTAPRDHPELGAGMFLPEDWKLY